MKEELDQIRKHATLFAAVVDVFAESVPQPSMYAGTVYAGFRYSNPTAKHFCLIKAVRSVSGLKAAVVLAEFGYNQEVCVLVRTIVDALRQIDYVLAGLHDHGVNERQKKVIENFFSDFYRNSSADFGKPVVRQEDIHREISRSMLEELHNVDPENALLSGPSPKALLYSVYSTYSNYVHARYPEVMDMFGGTPPRFHMAGMQGTPKDDESIAIIQSVANSVSLTLTNMTLKFDMTQNMRERPELRDWFPISRSAATEAG